ncbi:beta-lactamase family protein [Nocardia sp. NBC_00565]|uniref:serine hydrolase domain-containing protein n=1 Tax=Nocardia sp. NBC_00565 TaxID=2975993 RepID=UPI002E81146E|nr:serine hydrolase domain-containing protein [Nocardia sp. NBC_00565]WUC04429.1 beta-lactamase family protein [Nocardia sp. NBC_00565]
MSNVASSGDLADLPAGVGGSATAEFAPLVRAFAKVFGRRRGAGGALAVHLHGEPLVDIWAGSAGDTPWTQDTGTIIFSATKGVTATVIHRLADRGLLDYAAPVAEYWSEFGQNGKGDITIRQVMTHSAGLGGLHPIAAGLEDVLDHQLMEQRLAAAKPDRLLGTPAYHALTFGWLLAGLARAVTGHGMAELFRTEVAEPLGIDGIHLGLPPTPASTTYAPLAGTQLSLIGKPISTRVLGRSYALPGALGAAARCLFLPGLETILEGDLPPILDTELGAGNGVCTAAALATMYGALANDGTADGTQYLTPRTIEALSRIRSFRLDHALFYAPMLWHLGYHSLPMPGALGGFGHIGLGGSFGWAEPRLGLSVGFVHNRLSVGQLSFDQASAAWLLPMVMAGLRTTRRAAALVETPEAA